MSAFGPKRTWALALHMSAFDPKRTFSNLMVWACTMLRPDRRWNETARIHYAFGECGVSMASRHPCVTVRTDAAGWFAGRVQRRRYGGTGQRRRISAKTPRTELD